MNGLRKLLDDIDNPYESGLIDISEAKSGLVNKTLDRIKARLEKSIEFLTSAESGRETLDKQELMNAITASLGDFRHEVKYTEEDYKFTFLKEHRKMTFSGALAAMKLGYKVARKDWSCQGVYIWLLPAAEVKREWCKDRRLIEAMGDRDSLSCLGSIRMFTATKEVLTGWIPLPTDMLADDWVLVV